MEVWTLSREQTLITTIRNPLIIQLGKVELFPKAILLRQVMNLPKQPTETFDLKRKTEDQFCHLIQDK